MDDKTLIQSTLQGNIRAFNELVSVYHSPLITSARHLLRNADDAEDLVQETLLEAYRRLGDLRETEKFKPWVFTILRHKCLRYLQRRRLATEPLEEYHEALTAPEAPDASLLELMKHLSHPDQQILSACYLQGLSYGEIAGHLGISEHTARMRCLRARERLKLLVAQAEAEMRQVLQYAFSAPALDQQHATLPPASTGPTITGGVAMETYLLRYHMGEGQQTTYRCEDIVTHAEKDYFYVIRYDYVEKMEQITDDVASITVAFPNYRILRPPKEPAVPETELPVDTSTKFHLTLQRRSNGDVQNLHMHYIEGAMITVEVVDVMARGITFADHPLQIGEQWETSFTLPMRTGDYIWESARHQLTDVDTRGGCRYATIITKISHFMPMTPMWKAPEETETQGYGQTRELHVQTLFNITDGLVEQKSYSGTIINDIWLLEPERRHLRHDLVSVTGTAERVQE